VLDTVGNGGTLAGFHKGPPLDDTPAFITACEANLFCVAIFANPESGQPATDYIRAALSKGAHVVTSNKGPVAFAHRELGALAREKGVGFFFEPTVMNGAPVMGIGREAMPAAHILRIRGVLNSSTNFILTRMEQDGLDLEEAVKEAQAIGVTEADPSVDIDGWDAAIKTAILANVLMGADLTPQDIQPTGIRGVTADAVSAALAEGQRVRLVCEAVRGPDGRVQASVRPERVPLGDPLASVFGTSGLVEFEADTMRRLTIILHEPRPDNTAYGMLVDIINIGRGRHLA
jgi:homoserine dehydrogenase